MTMQPDGILLPSNWDESKAGCWLKADGVKQWMASISRPRPFTAIFINALCKEDYEAACVHNEQFEAWLSQGQRIIRRGSALTIPGEILDTFVNRCRYDVVMTEPDSIGFVDFRTTRIILTSVNFGKRPQITSMQRASAVDSPVEELDIGEDFLASSVLAPAISRKISAPHSIDPSSIQDEDKYPLRLHLHHLSSPVSLADDHTIYLRTSDLNKLGALSGDWVCFLTRSNYALSNGDL
jgi:peroxin-6